MRKPNQQIGPAPTPNHLARLACSGLMLASTLLVSCRSEPSAPPAASAPAQPHGRAPSTCKTGGERFDLHTNETVVAKDGTRVTFTGTEHDHYDNGETQLFAVLLVEAGGRRQTVYRSLLGESRDAHVLGYCISTSSTGDVLHIALALETIR